jgi:peptidoglycan/xylan/chitin deacetylase (PgdA/CDA1 family)
MIAVLALLLAALPAGKAAASKRLIEPRLTITPGSHHGPHVALTLDACSGEADERILHMLIEQRVPATIFATARWLKRNPAVVAEIKANPALFEVENHGARHLAAVDWPGQVFGVKTAGSLEALRVEIEGGERAVRMATGKQPRWFRGATGKYSKTAMELIARMNYRLAGYSLTGDGGARLSEAVTAKRIASAQDGDVIVAHVNQPHRTAGLGVIKGVLALKAKGFIFLRLEDAKPITADKRPSPTS